jgi:hypothetical protein
MDFRLTQLTAPAVAKSGAARHIIVKERLTRRARLHGFRPSPCARKHAENRLRVAYSSGDSNPPRDALRMTLLSTAQHLARSSRKDPRGHMVPILLGSLLAAGAVALVAYLLWPTWGTVNAKGPERLPVSVGGTLFNVPTAAIRRKIQRHSGPQERVDLGFLFPSLTPPEAPKHVSADTVEERPQPIDRIFLSITAHRDSLAPDMRVRTIYPRYLEQASRQVEDGLTLRAFKDGSPYGSEDMFSATNPSLVARCTRDAATPGMCLAERRIEGADLTFRFPRSWLAQWREVAAAMEKLTAQIYGKRS